MKRKIYSKLLEWKSVSNGRSAVMIDGARRVGKSWIAEEFAKNEYEGYLLIDFAKASKDGSHGQKTAKVNFDFVTLLSKCQ